MGLFNLVLVFVVPFILWGIINPRSQWQALSSWQYTNPDANEPSDAAFALGRIGGIVALIVMLVGGIQLL